ncbi:MAG: DUF4139 domain-containing protein [Elusimicrobiota bacterium]|nr:DUF4139 domain-containing protein [Elusimicrobiota bacterium]
MKLLKVFPVFLLLGLARLDASVNALKSVSEDQTAVEVTVYNSNLGLVKDTRRIKLLKGVGELRFMDVAASIMPVTVTVRSLTHKNDFSVLEQNYEYDLMSDKKLLDKYVGKKIKIIDWNKFKDRKEKVNALLLSNNRGQIYRIDDEIYLGHPGYKVLPEIPENLISKPTLMWLYENSVEDAHEIEVSYLTGGISWKADYIVKLNKDDTFADISGWVTLDNKSGAAYKDAKLKLVAGKVNRAEGGQMYNKKRMPGLMSADKGGSGFEEKVFFEYHIYDLQRKTTIKNNQTKQISLLSADSVGVKKEFIVYGARGYFTRMQRGGGKKQPVGVFVKFKNTEKNNLGMPLPGGIMRMYKKDPDSSLQFVGEDRVGHTPKDEEIKLKIGEAFDVIAERTQTDYRRITSSLHESEWEIALRNHKEEEIEVSLVEPLYGNWKVISKSHPYKKVDAFTVRFNVKVPKGGVVKVRYRVRVGLE